MKIKVKEEGRKNIWESTDKVNLKEWIKMKKFKTIHNFIPNGSMILGADYSVKSVLEDIDQADRIGIFTDPTFNLGHSLALICRGKLKCYDLGEITKENLQIVNRL